MHWGIIPLMIPIDSNHKNWVQNGRKGKEPTLTYHRNTMPVLYKPHMFLRTDRLTARIKVLHQKDWVWLEVVLREQDIRYIEKHCKLDNMQSPKLKRQGKCWYLAFPFERNVIFTDVPSSNLSRMEGFATASSRRPLLITPSIMP